MPTDENPIEAARCGDSAEAGRSYPRTYSRSDARSDSDIASDENAGAGSIDNTLDDQR